MLNLLINNPMAFFILFPGLIISLTIHEFAHALAADKLGDPTPRHQNRVTLNPLAHLDPIGTLMILLTSFGWGKPVEFDPYNLKNPIRDTALIALAGPLSNLVLATLLSVIIRLGVLPMEWMYSAAYAVLFVNVSLAIFNLIPVYPLDGSKILVAALPAQTALEYEDFMHRYGFLVLLFLILPLVGGVSPVSQLVSPIITFIIQVMLGLG
jgi:Zn-dependent protease